MSHLTCISVSEWSLFPNCDITETICIISCRIRTTIKHAIIKLLPLFVTTSHAITSCGTESVPLDETHLDAVRGLILARGFHPTHQQVELFGAMWLRSTRTNRSAYAYAKYLIQSWRISSLSLVSFRNLPVWVRPTYILDQYTSSLRGAHYIISFSFQ